MSYINDKKLNEIETILTEMATKYERIAIQEFYALCRKHGLTKTFTIKSVLIIMVARGILIDDNNAMFKFKKVGTGAY